MRFDVHIIVMVQVRMFFKQSENKWTKICEL